MNEVTKATTVLEKSLRKTASYLLICHLVEIIFEKGNLDYHKDKIIITEKDYNDVAKYDIKIKMEKNRIDLRLILEDEKTGTRKNNFPEEELLLLLLAFRICKKHDISKFAMHPNGKNKLPEGLSCRVASENSRLEISWIQEKEMAVH